MKIAVEWPTLSLHKEEVRFDKSGLRRVNLISFMAVFSLYKKTPRYKAPQIRARLVLPTPLPNYF